MLALADIASPVRAPFTLFFLFAAPGWALAAALRGLDPLSRALLAAGGAMVVDLLVAQGMLALGMWSVRGGVAVVAALSATLFLLSPARRAWGARAAYGRGDGFGGKEDDGGTGGADERERAG